MLVKLNDGRMKDVPVSEVTAENYVVSEKEKKFYHCKIELRAHSSVDGSRLSRPRIQKFGYKTFKSGVYDNLVRNGYSVEVLYDPTEYIAECKTHKTPAPMQTEAERKAEIEKAVAEALAEQEKKHADDIEKAVAKALKKAESAKKKAEKAEKKAENNPTTGENE